MRVCTRIGVVRTSARSGELVDRVEQVLATCAADGACTGEETPRPRFLGQPEDAPPACRVRSVCVSRSATLPPFPGRVERTPEPVVGAHERTTPSAPIETIEAQSTSAPPASSSTCGCRAAARGHGGSLALLACVVLGCALARRRRAAIALLVLVLALGASAAHAQDEAPEGWQTRTVREGVTLHSSASFGWDSTIACTDDRVLVANREGVDAWDGSAWTHIAAPEGARALRVSAARDGSVLAIASMSDPAALGRPVPMRLEPDGTWSPIAVEEGLVVHQALTVLSARDVFAAGNMGPWDSFSPARGAPALASLVEGRFRAFAAPSWVSLTGFGAGSGRDLFVTGDHGVLLRHDGRAWTSIATGTEARLGGVLAVSSNDVWAWSSPLAPGGEPTENVILHWNGQGIERRTPSGGSEVRGVVERDGAIYVITRDAVQRWNGSTFDAVLSIAEVGEGVIGANGLSRACTTAHVLVVGTGGAVAMLSI